MAEVVLDANVLVALLDSRDVHAARAAALVDRLAADGHDAVIVGTSAASKDVVSVSTTGKRGA